MELTDEIKIDWHGHQDRGLGVINSIAAYEAGYADRLHGTALGIGERVGNAPMDHSLVNLQLMGYIDRDLSNLTRYCDTVSIATGVPISISIRLWPRRFSHGNRRSCRGGNQGFQQRR
jgi:2-isopropylmalate synthase